MSADTPFQLPLDSADATLQVVTRFRSATLPAGAFGDVGFGPAQDGKRLCGVVPADRPEGNRFPCRCDRRIKLPFPQQPVSPADERTAEGQWLLESQLGERASPLQRIPAAAESPRQATSRAS